jgi:hypothetical protein
MHGLELIDEIGRRSNGAVRADQANLYLTLRRLEDEGFLSTYTDGIAHPERGGRPRRYWHLESGRREPDPACGFGGRLVPCLGAGVSGPRYPAGRSKKDGSMIERIRLQTRTTFAGRRARLTT